MKDNTENAHTDEDRWLRTGEAAAMLGISPQWLRELVKRNLIPATAINTHNRYRQSDIDAHLHQQGLKRGERIPLKRTFIQTEETQKRASRTVSK